MNSFRSTSSRRHFLKQIAVAGAVTALPVHSFAAQPKFATKEGALHSALGVVKNRAPLTPSAFYTLPLGSVMPKGWLRQQLQVQADGLSGHLDETWADVGPNSGWLGGTGESWERGPYYLDGLLPLAYLLNDDVLKMKAHKYIEWTLTNQSVEGMIGPLSNNDWWPRMVMVKVLAQYQEVTGDPRVIPVLTRYFHYQLSMLPARPITSWGKYRWQDEVLIVLWLYNRTGDPKLLDLARLLRSQGYDWQAQFADFHYTQRCTRESSGMQTHGVNNAQAMKASPVWSLISGKEEDRQAIFHQLAMLDEYHGLPNGMFSADEHFAGRNPSQGIELCAVVEMMFSLQQSLAILGSPELGDRLERIAYNALPGTLTDDMWAHQYNQEPNQVECSSHHSPWTTDGPDSNLFGLEPNFGCCTANFHQGWPKMAANLWMSSADDGLVAATYGPSEVRTVAGGVAVHLLEETEYPFRDTVRITVNPASPVDFPLRLRIPEWAAGASIRINGQLEPTPAPKTFAQIKRLWKAGDVVEMKFPMAPRLAKGFNGSVAIERGPLVFSFPVGADWVKLRDRGMTADWQVYPTTPWNYALAVHDDTAHVLAVEERVIGKQPFALRDAPVRIEVSARRLMAWTAVDGVAAPVPQSPVESTEIEEEIILVPYAAAKLRITSFPQLKD